MSRMTRHLIRYRGLPDGRIEAYCEQCPDGGWFRTFDPHHTTADWVKLEDMHNDPGLPPGTPVDITGRNAPYPPRGPLAPRIA